jgi:cellulose synthase operon protein C
MTALSSIQIPKPSDWQAFERLLATLWSEILDDDAVQRFGSGGQQQHGLDLTGYRKGDPSRFVGVQCKCKGPREKVTAKEFRNDVGRALKLKPALQTLWSPS